MSSKETRPLPSEVEYKGFKFLITERPSDETMPEYIQQLQKHNVTVVVRVCKTTYKTEDLEESGITVFNLEFNDGNFPSSEIAEKWFKIIKNEFLNDKEACVAVHCVAGLGRAPVMVALALVELGLPYESAVELIREKRRGAINTKQLAYLQKHRSMSRLKLKNSHLTFCCI